MTDIKKNAFRWLAVSAVISSWWSCAGKDDASDADAPDEEGLRLCCELGALCHVADDETDAEVSECHELGHVIFRKIAEKNTTAAPSRA